MSVSNLARCLALTLGLLTTASSSPQALASDTDAPRTDAAQGPDVTSVRRAGVERDYAIDTTAFVATLRLSDRGDHGGSTEGPACADRDKREQLRGRIETAVIEAATEFLALPMGTGRVRAVNGETYLFCLEPHYHPPGYTRGPTGWHKGVTVYEVAKTANAARRS